MFQFETLLEERGRKYLICVINKRISEWIESRKTPSHHNTFQQTRGGNLCRRSGRNRLTQLLLSTPRRFVL